MSRAWKGTTFGNTWMHKWLMRILRYTDVQFIYAFTAIFVLPVVLMVNPSRGIIYRYFRERFGYGRWKACRKTYANHLMFAQAVIDKFALWAGKKYEVEVLGYDHFLRLANQSDGFVQLSAHVGNYEVAGYSLVAETKRFNALVFGGEKEMVVENRKKMFAHTHIRMIPTQTDMSHLFEINEALNNGEIVSISADRFMGSAKSFTREFLGATTKFPQGPFAIAAAKEVDVLAVFVMKTSLKRYTIHVVPLHYDRTACSRAKAEQLASAYVTELEKIMRKYPTQWYNYYEFWYTDKQ